MIEITASESERHVQIKVGERLIGRVTRIGGRGRYEISSYDSEEDHYSRLRKSSPALDPYESFPAAVSDLLKQCGYGKVVVDATIGEVNLMPRVTL